MMASKTFLAGVEELFSLYLLKIRKPLDFNRKWSRIEQSTQKTNACKPIISDVITVSE